MKFGISIFLALFFLQAKSQLHLSALFNDHMIMQRDKPVKIWGSARAGDSVYVNIGTVKAAVKTGNNGLWLITLPSFKAGGPYTISIHTAKDSKIFLEVISIIPNGALLLMEVIISSWQDDSVMPYPPVDFSVAIACRYPIIFI